MLTPTRINRVEIAVSKMSGVTIYDMKSNSRFGDYVDARMAVWIVAKDYLGYSYAFLGRLYNKDHTTIMHGCNKMRELKALKGIVNAILRVNPNAFSYSPELNTKPLKNWNIDS